MSQDKNRKKSVDPGQRGTSSGGSDRTGGQAGGSPSYEDERKTKAQGMGSGRQPPESRGFPGQRQDTETARKVGDQQTTLNSSGVQEGSGMVNQDADDGIDADRNEAHRRGAA